MSFMSPASDFEAGHSTFGENHSSKLNSARTSRPISAPAVNQILAYVDGKAVSVTKGSSGTGAGNFANSTLYFMSRGGTTQFAPATLDEVAIYDTALTASQIAAHYAARQDPISLSGIWTASRRCESGPEGIAEQQSAQNFEAGCRVGSVAGESVESDPEPRVDPESRRRASGCLVASRSPQDAERGEPGPGRTPTPSPLVARSRAGRLSARPGAP